MHLRAFEEIGYGREPDMGMRANVDAPSRCEIDGAEIVEEHERADRALMRLRQHACHAETVSEFAFQSGQIAHR